MDFFGIRKPNKTDDFLNRLSSLDEENYFHIASGLLGAIPTPFNKQTLNGSILSFFINEENKRNMMSAINDEERTILRFVSLMAEANIKQIESFCNDTNHYVLVLKLENLCDRLLLFKTTEGYVVNPLLEDDIKEMAAESGIGTNTNTKNPYVDSNVLRAVLNMMIGGAAPQREANLHHFYKSGKLQAVFPQFEDQKAIRMFELIRKVIIESDAFKWNGSHLSLDRHACRKLFTLPTIDVCLSAIGVWYGPELENAVAKALPVLMEFPMEAKRFRSIVSATMGDCAPDGFIQDLVVLGLFNEVSAGCEIIFNEAVAEPPLKMSALTIDSDMMVSYYGIPDEYDILYLFADVQKCDKLIVYAITKASFSRALGLEVTTDEIEGYLKDSKTNMVLEQWEKAVSRVKLYDGIVLKCTEEVSFLVHKLIGINRNVITEIGDGIFLMKRSMEDQWGRVLSKALDMESLPSPICENPYDGSLHSKVFHRHDIKYEQKETEKSTKSTAVNTPSWDDVKKVLLEDANAKGCMTAELENLIDSKRIVSTSQIGKNFKYEKLPTAGGFDFNAKLSLIKKAIGRKANSNPIPLKLELLEEEVLAVPLEIQGSGSKAFLKAAVLPEGAIRTIPVGTIFQVTLMRSV